ncbi:allantoate permease [Hyphopichia burtonii NRRL Y-1933]|uniref:Allantoate permease n=1 Tax=Hyphopichia burtonii NRRL Y-1933 TaxID=984485 RepID=A0A1E4RBK5_9ASCO|nr:allantoate permease [Hyphopichia burtonii NRRL Y-1933]ODV64647.1 allantoate permease [Hyphopichia burtonii NRRL Y-1933]
MLVDKNTTDEKLNTVISFTDTDIDKQNAANVITSIISPSGKEVKVTGDVDEAMKYAIRNTEEHIELDPKASRRLFYKLNICLLPLICLLYCFQFMDKLSNSYASILGLRDPKIGLNMVGDQYSWTGSAFYLGYLFFEFPTSLLLQRFPVITTTSIFIIIWGFVLAMGLVCGSHGSQSGYAGFIFIRTIQGGLESIITPAFTLYTGFWYKKDEVFLITSLWFASNGLGTILGSGAVAHSVFQHRESYDLAPWKLVFIITGVLTIGLGIAMFFYLPNTPAQAWFLNDEEKKMVVERLRETNQGFGNKHFKIHQFKEAFLDVKTWLFFIFAFCNNIPNGGLTNFGSILLNEDLDYSTGKALLMQMPLGAVEIVGCVLFAYCYKFYQKRLFWATLGTAITLASQCMLAFLKNNKVQLAGYTLYSLGPIGFICVLSCIGSNVLGTTKKQTTNAIYLISYCVGNLVGPQTFKASESPDYPSAKLAIVICGAISLVTLIVLWVYLEWENKRRDKNQTELHIENIEFADLTDKENPYFRYVI